MKLNPQVFIDAAELIDRSEYNGCADAIAAIPPFIHVDHMQFFIDLFRPTGTTERTTIFWEPGDRQSRVLALLFCAAICKRGGL
jgi:hypothetical protein